jgi:hypothetical protein
LISGSTLGLTIGFTGLVGLTGFVGVFGLVVGLVGVVVGADIDSFIKYSNLHKYLIITMFLSKVIFFAFFQVC